MPLCAQCLSISLPSLISEQGHLLHNNWPSLQRSALTCELCQLVFSRIGEALQIERQEAIAALGSKTGLFLDPETDISLYYDRQRSVGGLLAEKEGKLRRIRNKPTDFSYLYIRLRYPSEAPWRPAVQPSLLVYIHPGDPLGTIGFQERNSLAADPLDETVTSKIQAWVEECADKHEECNIDKNVRRILPKRLLSLKDVNSKGLLTIEEVPSDFSSKYVTLSYCWGPTRDQRWLDYLSEIQTKHKPVEVSRMPKTLSDAVSVSLALGYESIWIDCLCILQNNAVDWRRESAKMSSIYEGAALTLSASDTADCRHGFLGLRGTMHRYGIPLRLTTEDGRTGTLCVSLHEQKNSFASTVRRGPVATRAWCLQERRLALRGMLHMCHNQIIYECFKSRHFESEVSPSEELVEDGYQLVHMPRTDTSALVRGKPSGRVGNILQWYGIVEDYMTTKLTMPSDKLVAIAGLAQSANRNLKSRYLAGLWERHFHIGLCWAITEEWKQPLSRSKEYRAPSWSWASVDGPVNWLVDGWVQSEDGFLESAIELTAIDMDVDEAGPYGQVKRGNVTVNGRLKMIKAEVLQENEILTYPKWMSGSTSYVGYYLEDERRKLTGSLYCLKVAMRPYGPGPSIPPTNSMLVVQLKGKDTYVRLGYGQVMETTFFDDSPIQTIKLV